MNIVLVNPEIPFNTGNIGRACVATGSVLHLVGKLGFKIHDKEIRRSGLDYWAKLSYKYYENFEEFLKSVADKGHLYFFSSKANKTLWQAKFCKGGYLVFGSESAGLPRSAHDNFKGQFYRIPASKEIRSLNLSSSASIALYEALRQTEDNTKLFL